MPCQVLGPPEAGRSRKEPPQSLEPSGQAGPAQFLASRTVQEQISAVLNHRVCSNLLQQPWETNIDTIIDYVLKPDFLLNKIL